MQMLDVPLNNGFKTLTKHTFLIGLALIQSICGSSLQSELYITHALQTHRVHYLAWRTSFSHTITSYRNAYILLKVSNVCRVLYFTPKNVMLIIPPNTMTKLYLVARFH